jgi:hypothetical protein
VNFFYFFYFFLVVNFFQRFVKNIFVKGTFCCKFADFLKILGIKNHLNCLKYERMCGQNFIFSYFEYCQICLDIHLWDDHHYSNITKFEFNFF